MKFATISVELSADPTQPRLHRLLGLLLLMTLKDQANSLRFTYEPGLLSLSYQIDGEWHELIPPPEHLGPRIGWATRRLINPSRFRRWLADRLRRLANRFDIQDDGFFRHHFMLMLGPTWSLWRVTIQEGNGRGEISFDVLECTDWAYDQVCRIELPKETSSGDSFDMINPSRIQEL